jgi:hypothetical protein
VNGPRPVNVIVFALLAMLTAVLLVTAVMKARLAGMHADRENERRPRSIAADGDTGRPDWFRNMDRDTDGRLSRKEFVGTDEQFGHLDADGDGYISVTEAWAKDEWFRTQVPR